VVLGSLIRVALGPLLPDGVGGVAALAFCPQCQSPVAVVADTITKRSTCNRSSATCTVSQPQTLGRQVAFFLNDREVGETVTVTLTMRDGVGNIKNDTIKFVCVAP
jgi:hypothetical protein